MKLMIKQVREVCQGLEDKNIKCYNNRLAVSANSIAMVCIISAIHESLCIRKDMMKGETFPLWMKFRPNTNSWKKPRGI